MSRILGLVLLALIMGCGDSTAVVSGNVTYDGQAVENGFIQFQPIDNKGASCGGPITDGRYEIETSPGKKLVQVMATKAVQYGRRNPEEEARLVREAAARGDQSGIVERADVIPPNAEGNNVEVDFQPGSQTLDFDLKQPAVR